MACGECQKKEQKCQQMTYFVVKWHADKVGWNKYCGNRKKNPQTRNLCIPKEIFTKPEKNAEERRGKSRHQRWSLCRIEPFQWRRNRILMMTRARFHVMCHGKMRGELKECNNHSERNSALDHSPTVTMKELTGCFHILSKCWIREAISASIHFYCIDLLPRDCCSSAMIRA